VISIVIVVLILFYQQISTVFQKYEEGFHYDQVQTIHAANNVKNFMLQEDITNLIESLTAVAYLDITEFPFKRQQFYEKLKELSNIKAIYLMPFDLNNLINNISNYGFEPLLIDYLKNLNKHSTDETSSWCRLVLVFNDHTFTNILMNS